jgi:head-tail adaptor
MSERNLNRRRLSKFSIGDMRERISLFRRATFISDFDSPEAGEKHTLLAEVWAQIDTPRMGDLRAGDQSYNGVNPEAIPTHRFTIRHRTDVSSHDTIVKWNGKTFNLVNTGVISPQGRDQYLVLSAVLLGDSSKGANQ